MKLCDRSTEIESIDIQYKNGKRYSIWLPQEVNIALKLLVEEDEEGEYTEDELKKRRSPKEIVEYAKAHLGDKGYDIVNNNCEHFSNECAFGEHKSFQVESVMGLLFNLFGGK